MAVRCDMDTAPLALWWGTAGRHSLRCLPGAPLDQLSGLTAPDRAWAGWRPLTHCYRRWVVAELPGASVSPISVEVSGWDVRPTSWWEDSPRGRH